MPKSQFEFPGLYQGLPFSTYRAIDAVNWHTLVHMRQSARHCRAKMLRPDDANDEQRLGEYSHACIMEPTRLATDYAVMPEFEGHPNSTAHKAAKAAWIEAHKERVPLTAEELERAQQMIASIDAHPLASKLLRSPTAKKEVTIVWLDKGTSLLCKGRIDLLDLQDLRLLDKYYKDESDRKVVTLADLKTTRAGTGVNGNSKKTMVELFNYDRLTYGYHGQLAFYADGLAAINPADILPVIVAVQNAAEYDVIVCPFSALMYDAGRALYRGLLDKFAACKASGQWPGVSDGVVDLEVFSAEIEDDNG